MPTERRKVQNRINQRRYRMQIKNRIQMLEQAIIDSGVATGLDLGLKTSTITENDETPSGHQSFSTPDSDGDAVQDVDSQDLGSWDFDPSPDSLDENEFFMNQDLFKSWNQSDVALDQGTSPLPFTPDLNQPSNVSHRLTLPWQEPASSQIQTPPVTSIPGSHWAVSKNCEGAFAPSRKESLGSKFARGRLRKVSTVDDEKEAKKSRTTQRKARDPKERIISSLREENKRLKELSTALVNMYDCTAKPTSAGKEVPQCHNLHATVKKLITHSFSRAAPDSVHRKNGGSSRNDIESSDIEPSCSPAEIGLAHLSMQDLEFSDLCAEMTGCSVQAGLPELMGVEAWSSHPDHPMISHSHVQTKPQVPHPPINYTPTSVPTLSSLPLPSSHAYLEPTFSRRLVRLLWEYAFKVLTHPSIAPGHLNRCFGFCLRSRSQETLVRKFKAYLGLSLCAISELDRQSWNAAPDVRDSMDGGSDEWDYWIEAGKIETYLESLGFCLGENIEETTSQALSQNNGLIGRRVESFSTTSSTTDDTQASQPAPQVPYGSKWQPNLCITNTLFDDDGNFHVPASWLTPSPSDAVVTAEPLVTPGHSTYLNAERLVQPGSGCYLDVSRFFAGLIDVAVCLGRAAGFRRVDVDKVLKKCLVSCKKG